MNPYRIYRDEWARALAKQATAPEYVSFVALPFCEHFSYRSREVLSAVIGGAVQEANRRGETLKRFAKPERVDVPGGATVITDDIVQGIMESHVFIGDLTFENPGVILETGIAFATKPLEQIVLITQGSPVGLHFDLSHNRVLVYSPEGEVVSFASALVAAATSFEADLAERLRDIAKRLSPDAIKVLNWYGRLQREHGPTASLHAGTFGPYFEGDDARIRFGMALRELRDKDLMWTDYKVGAIPGGDAYGTHATEMGWLIIENMWPVLRRESTFQQRSRP